jgi:hypothetical protein
VTIRRLSKLYRYRDSLYERQTQYFGTCGNLHWKSLIWGYYTKYWVKGTHLRYIALLHWILSVGNTSTLYSVIKLTAEYINIYWRRRITNTLNGAAELSRIILYYDYYDGGVRVVPADWSSSHQRKRMASTSMNRGNTNGMPHLLPWLIKHYLSLKPTCCKCFEEIKYMLCVILISSLKIQCV